MQKTGVGDHVLRSQTADQSFIRAASNSSSNSRLIFCGNFLDSDLQSYTATITDVDVHRSWRCVLAACTHEYWRISSSAVRSNLFLMQTSAFHDNRDYDIHHEIGGRDHDTTNTVPNTSRRIDHERIPYSSLCVPRRQQRATVWSRVVLLAMGAKALVHMGERRVRSWDIRGVSNHRHMCTRQTIRLPCNSRTNP